MIHFSRITSSASSLLLFLVLLLASMTEPTNAGPIAAGSGVAMCYSACNAGYVTCMVGCGLVAGVAGPMAVPAAAGCSTTQGACMAACTTGGLVALVTPTP
ncbi:unnamed protein product [Cylindrotheca closterium]|uniref:Cysteine-rich protein n=1 Tax=Cylindrotheca closterium TaxID=2856 RepID=A0AAD2G7X9_9STRA|nr:unnamed protein product [Cylindrotheca closterium]